MKLSLKLVDKYVSKEYITACLAFLIVFLVLLTAMKIFEDLDEMLRYQANFWDCFLYILLSIPFILVKALPLIMVMGTVFCLRKLLIQKEVIAMLAGGVSLKRIVLPIILLSLLVSLLILFWNETIASHCNAWARNIWYNEIDQKQPIGKETHYGHWLRGTHNRMYNFQTYDQHNKRIYKLRIYQFAPGHSSLLNYLEAEKAIWLENKQEWVLLVGQKTVFNSEGKSTSFPFSSFNLAISEQPLDFAGVQRPPEEMNYRELKHFINLLAQTGEDVSRYLPELYIKISFPLACFFLTWLAIGLVNYGYFIWNNSRGSTTMGLGACIAAVLIYYGLLIFFLGLGQRGIIPPFISVWLPNLFVLISSITLTRKLDF